MSRNSIIQRVNSGCQSKMFKLRLKGGRESKYVFLNLFVNYNSSLPLEVLITPSPAVTTHFCVVFLLPGLESQSYHIETGTKNAFPRFPHPPSLPPPHTNLLVLVLTSERPARARKPNSFGKTEK